MVFNTWFECQPALDAAIKEFNDRYKQDDDLFNQYQTLLRQIQRQNICTKELTTDLETCKNRLSNCGYTGMSSSPMIAPQGVFYQTEPLAASSLSDLKLEDVPRFNWLAVVPTIGVSLAKCSDIFNGVTAIPTTVGNTQQNVVPGQPITYWNGLLHTNFVRLSNRIDALKPKIIEASRDYFLALNIYKVCCDHLSALHCSNAKRCNDPSDPIMQAPVRDACIPEDFRNDGVI